MVITVGELVKKLQKLPQDYHIVTSDDLGDGFNFAVQDVVLVSQEHLEDCRVQPGQVCYCEGLKIDANGGLVAII